MLDKVKSITDKAQEETDAIWAKAAAEVNGVLTQKMRELQALEPAFNYIMFGMGGHAFQGDDEVIDCVESDGPDDPNPYHYKSSARTLGQESTEYMVNREAAAKLDEIKAIIEAIDVDELYNKIYCAQTDIDLTEKN